MKSLDEVGDEFLLCIVCNNEYDDERRAPILLPCLHTICDSCAHTTNQTLSVTCPVCKEEHPLLPNQPLPKDATMKSMIDMVRVQRKPSTILCLDCPDKGVGDNYCKDCCSFLCEECTSAHKRTQLTRRHSVVSIEELKKSGLEGITRKEMCSVSGHEDQPYTFYCDKDECQTPVCTMCALSDHNQANGHVIKKLGEIYSENRKLIEQMVGELLNKISNICSELKSTEAEDDSVQEKQEGVFGQIDRMFDAYETMLRKRRMELKEQYQKICKDNRKDVSERLEMLKSSKNSMETCCNYSSRLLAFTNKTEFLQLKSTVAKRLGSLIDAEEEKEKKHVHQADISFKQGISDEQFKEFIDKLGRLDLPSNMQETYQGPHNIVSEVPPPERENVAFKQEFLTKSSSIKQTNATPSDGKLRPAVEPLQLEGLNDDLPSLNIADVKPVANHLSGSTVSENHVAGNYPSFRNVSQPRSLELNGSKSLSSNSFKRAPVKISPMEDNVLGRPLKLKSPIFTPKKNPAIGLGDFLSHLVVPYNYEVKDELQSKSRLFLRDDSDESPDGKEETASRKSPSTEENPKKPDIEPAKTYTPSKWSPQCPVAFQLKTSPDLTKTFPPAHWSPKSPVSSQTTSNGSSAVTVPSPTTPTSATFGDVTCPEFKFDQGATHSEREVSHDGSRLRNKRTNLYAPANTSARQLKQYKGSMATLSFKDLGKYYYEVEVTYTIQQPLEETWLVFEIGVCREEDVDKHHTVERHEHARSFYVARYPEDGKLAQEFWHNRDLLSYLPLSENKAGIEVHVTYGFVVDTRRKRWEIVDVLNDKVLHSFGMVTFGKPLFPVFGCYNPDLITVEMKLKTGSEITEIPNCVKGTSS